MMAVTVNNPSTRKAGATNVMVTDPAEDVDEDGEILTPENVQSKALKQISPDCVADLSGAITQTKASRGVPVCDYQVPLKSSSSSSKHKKSFAKVGSIDLDRGTRIDPQPCYNLPPLRTPTCQSRRAPHALKKLPSLPLSRLPEHSSPKLDEEKTSLLQGLTSAPVPRIPRPIPFSAANSKRSQSENLAQTKSNERRSIFGHYFDHHQRQKRSMSDAGAALPGPRRLNECQPGPLLQRPETHRRSSSCSILETHLTEQIPIDYRMFAPPPEYAKVSPICQRFEAMGSGSMDPDNSKAIPIIEDLSANMVEQDLQRKSLPPLPSPLRRFCSSSDINNGSTRSVFNGGMHGMYPLIKPVSILKQSSYRRTSSFHLSGEGAENGSQFGNRDKNRLNAGNHRSATSPYSYFLASSFNLTESYRHLDPSGIRSHSAMERKASTTSTSSSDDTPISLQNGVRFDPRVTVTEFEDPEQRDWYDGFELEVLRRETIQTAHKYMLSHPMEAENYNRVFLDPVTNTYRRKALYSLPALSAESISDTETGDDDQSSRSLASMPTKSLLKLSQEQVKRILIVDPNPSIRELFCKSMSSMFPNADLVTAPNADRALKLVKKSLGTAKEEKNDPPFSPLSKPSDENSGCGTFDIIVIEQSLYPYSPQVVLRKRDPPLVTSSAQSTASGGGPPTPRHDYPAGDSANGDCFGLPWTSSMPDMKKCLKNGRHDDASLASSFQSITQPGSFFDHDSANRIAARCREPRCGSELTRAIVELEQQHSFRSPEASDGSTAELSLPPFKWSALLIGVSMQPDRDARQMQEAGSDIIWGKPIPRVGDALRNQLLQALVDKRRGIGW